MLIAPGLSAAEDDRPDASDYARSIANWQEQREAGLKSADGWLNLIGLVWLQAGTTSIGSSSESDIELTEELAPSRLGEFLLEDEQVWFETEPGVEVDSDDGPVTRIHMLDDQADTPTRLTYGRLVWRVIRRMDRFGVRLRDYAHPAVSAFAGPEFYPVDPAWRVEARFNAYAEPRRPLLTTVVEELGWNPVAPGTLEFELASESLSLEVYDLDDRFFLIFSDLTRARDTYPAGRYLYAEKPNADGVTILDFNKATSPPCAYTDFATCPLPTRENRLSLAIEAGEKYAKGD